MYSGIPLMGCGRKAIAPSDNYVVSNTFLIPLSSDVFIKAPLVSTNDDS